MECNAKNGITGLLLHHNQRFIQFIEGAKPDIVALFERIKKDSLHKEVNVLASGTYPFRMFPSWDMAYDNLDEKGQDVYLKRRRFEKLFHSSDFSCFPIRAKLKFWRHSQEILDLSLA